MKCAWLEQDKTFRIAPCDIVTPGPGQVRIEVAYCGVCGTDVHIYHGHMDQRVRFPQTIGHESSGTVADIGSGVDDLAVGDPVVVRPLEPCGECGACRAGHAHICYHLNFIGIDSPGAFQGSWTVPAHTVHPLPTGLDLKLAAFVEPLAVACHDNRLAEVAAGENVVVLGGGPIGLLNALVARNRGARVLVAEVNPARLARAADLDFEVVNPRQDDLKRFVERFTGGVSADVVFEVSGAAESIRMMTALARSRGRIVIVAIVPDPQPVNLFDVFWRELTFVGTRVYEPQDYNDAIDLVASGALPLEKLITAELALDQVAQAFELLEQDPAQMKIMIDCSA